MILKRFKKIIYLKCTSSGVIVMQAWYLSTARIYTKFSLDIIAAFGSPVVPEVYENVIQVLLVILANYLILAWPISMRSFH